MKKAGAFAVAKKVYDEARKPHNQAKIKEAARKLQERRGWAWTTVVAIFKPTLLITTRRAPCTAGSPMTSWKRPPASSEIGLMASLLRSRLLGVITMRGLR